MSETTPKTNSDVVFNPKTLERLKFNLMHIVKMIDDGNSEDIKEAITILSGSLRNFNIKKHRIVKHTKLDIIPHTSKFMCSIEKEKRNSTKPVFYFLEEV